MVTDNLPFIYVDPCVFILGVNPVNQQSSEIIPDNAFKVNPLGAAVILRHH